MTGPVSLGSLKDQILRNIGLMGRQRYCFEDDASGNNDADNGGAGGATDWREALPEDLRADKSLEPYKLGEGEQLIPVPAGLIKSHIKQQPLIGSKLVMPKEGDPQEKWDAFFTAIGRPETGDGYELVQEEGWKDLPYSEKLEGWFKESAYKIGLTKRQAADLYKGYQGYIKGMYDEANAEMEKDHADGLTALTKEWGSAARENIKLADRVFHTLFPDETVSERLRVLLGSNPGFIKAMFDISKLIGEDKLVGEMASQTRGAKSRDELKAMMADPRYQTEAAYRKTVDDEYKKAFPG